MKIKCGPHFRHLHGKDFDVIAFSLIYLAVFFVEVALGGLTPPVTLILVSGGVPKEGIGIVAAASYFGMFCGGRLMGPVIAACGHICAFAMCCALLAGSILLMHDADSVLLWGILRVATGVGSIGVFTVVESWINGAVLQTYRSRAFGMYTFASLSGAALGRMTMKFSPYFPALLDFAGIAMITAILPIAALTRGGPALLPRTGLSILGVFRLSPPGGLTCFTAGFATCSLYTMLSVVLKDMHLRNGQISALIASCMLAGMIVQLPACFLADRFGRHRVATVALAASTLFALMLMMTHSLAPLWCFAVLYCASCSPLYRPKRRARPACAAGGNQSRAAVCLGAQCMFWAAGGGLCHVLARRLVTVPGVFSGAGRNDRHIVIQPAPRTRWGCMSRAPRRFFRIARRNRTRGHQPSIKQLNKAS